MRTGTSRVIYADHHATTPLAREARDAMTTAMSTFHGNPSSVHAAGRRARALVEDAREFVANACGAGRGELVFTSGGTESVHLAVRGAVEARSARTIVVDPAGHPSLLAAANATARAHGATVAFMPIDVGGAPRLEALARLLESAEGPRVLAVSLVQHETGALAPVRPLADVCNAHEATLVLDAAQAFGKVPVDLPTSGALAAALSAHKIGGPTGVGATWFSSSLRVKGQNGGGAQERGFRAGTENVLGIVGFGAAARTIEARLAATESLRALRDAIEGALAAIDGVVVNGAESERVAGALHVSMRGSSGEELVAAFDVEGVCVSSGPACASGKPEPSASMRALYPDEPWRASSALRITLGPENTASDAERIVDVARRVIGRVRAVAAG